MPVHEIKKDIHWVGVVDWNLRNFHGYSLARRGTTYNAYLAMDDKITLFDTVAQRFSKEFIHQISRVVDPEKIDYLVVNHVEPDHSGALAEVVELVKPEKIFCSKMGEKTIRSHYHPDGWPLEPVENGQSINLGRLNVHFLETKMLHWPDSMVSYLPEEKLLISSDAFGQNWATSERFDDEVDQDILFREAGAYFANIILPYSALVKKVLARVQEAGLEIDMIAPDHGLIWRSNVAGILAKYNEWSDQKPTNKAVIVYDTMWQSTEKMARSLAEGMIREGIDVKIMHLKSCHHSDVMAEVLDAGAIVVGSPTHNNTILPNVAGMLTYMKGLRPQNKLGLAFGSFGWSGESVKLITEYLEQMKMDIMEPYKVQYIPAHEHLKELVDVGAELARNLKAKTS